jgi:tetratricopeptide (TPR) repeat protein
MSKQIPSNRFIVSPFPSKQAGFYQDLLRGVLSYPQLGDRLIRLAEQAHIFRQFDKVKEYAQLLASLPLKPYQAFGHYFLGVAANSKGNGDQDEARRLFEFAADIAPDSLIAKAVLSLAAVAANTRDYPSQLRYFIESAKASRDVSTTVKAHLGIAIYKSREGFHKQSLNDLENLYTLARHSQPIVFFDYLNSLAVELGEVGRKDEARNIMRVVLASPFAFAYPEWRATAQELRSSRRSFVAVSPSRFNVLTLPEREASEQRSFQPKPARVLHLSKWKKKMAKKAREKQTEQLLEEMSLQDMGFKLLEIITDNHVDEEQMRVILSFVMKLLAAPVQPPDKPSA